MDREALHTRIADLREQARRIRESALDSSAPDLLERAAGIFEQDAAELAESCGCGRCNEAGDQEGAARATVHARSSSYDLNDSGGRSRVPREI